MYTHLSGPNTPTKQPKKNRTLQGPKTLRSAQSAERREARRDGNMSLRYKVNTSHIRRERGVQKHGCGDWSSSFLWEFFVLGFLRERRRGEEKGEGEGRVGGGSQHDMVRSVSLDASEWVSIFNSRKAREMRVETCFGRACLAMVSAAL